MSVAFSSAVPLVHLLYFHADIVVPLPALHLSLLSLACAGMPRTYAYSQLPFVELGLMQTFTTRQWVQRCDAGDRRVQRPKRRLFPSPDSHLITMLDDAFCDASLCCFLHPLLNLITPSPCVPLAPPSPSACPAAGGLDIRRICEH